MAWLFGMTEPTSAVRKTKFRPRGYTTFFELAEHEIFSRNEYENTNNTSVVCIFVFINRKYLCLAIFGKQKFAIVSNFRFVSNTNVMLS